MIIDLHLHTELSLKNGDRIWWKTEYDTLSKLKNNKVKMAAFTDHNIFDTNFYLKTKELAKTGGIVLLPGIEINVVRHNGIIGHMLVLFEENLSESQLKEIEDQRILKTGISINQINDLYSNFNTLRIIHIGKTDYFSVEDLDNLKYDAFEITNFNHPNYKSVLKSGYSSAVVAFSDTHLWDKYPENWKLVTEIDELKTPTFQELKKALETKKIFAKENK